MEKDILLCNLCDLPLNTTAVVIEIDCSENLINRVLDLGIISGVEITPIFKSPFGDPVAYSVKNTIIALRNKDSRFIKVKCGD